MAHTVNNPNGLCTAMDITIGAFKTDANESKKLAKTVEGFALGDSEFFHGILPQWKFIDEKHFEKWEKLQVKYHAKLLKAGCKRSKQIKEDFEYSHNILLCLAGPEWYQELSPQQKDIIDTLHIAMKKDLDIHLTRATQSSLSRLGMRPLPNDTQLWSALIDSFGCPVEFLLVLYQLIKPHRKYYSINDRLLLSGVAHLCLRDTLREMHVRFPSPPREKKKRPPIKHKPPKKEYAHVYLEPFTYEWPQRKAYKYTNPVIQKPECQYFSYICGMDRKRMVFKCSSKEAPNRVDDDIKIPCDLFNDHLQAEEYYNIMFKHDASFRYIILRPRIYETTTPKMYPGVLPIFMIKKKYPPPVKLHFDFKIYNEKNPKNNRKRKVIKAVCEAKVIPSGRPGQKLGEKIVAKYVFVKNIGAYFKDSSISFEDSFEGGDYPCSLCGGPERKRFVPEIKPKKVKSWIKRPPKKKKLREMYEYRLSDPQEEQKAEIVIMDEEALRIQKENAEYCQAWEDLFKKIAEMDKLRLETETCVCPDKSKRPSRFTPENDCTCAIWNIPSPPKIEPPKFTCECESKSEEILPTKAKCDCKQKAREKALEACERCGLVKPKTEEEEQNSGRCRCTQILDACGNCVKQTPMKFPLLEEENKNEDQKCGCLANPPEEANIVTVGYVFVNNQPEIPGKECSCVSNSDGSPNAPSRINEKERQKFHAKNSGPSKKTLKQEKEECLRSCAKLSELDDCRRDVEKILQYLKCDCPKCKELRKGYRKRVKYIHAGARDACGGVLPVIGGTFGTEKVCECLQKFEDRVRGVIDYQKRMKAKLNLKSQENRYVISGVRQTFDGPIYNIVGIEPKKPCICKTSQEKLEEKERKENVNAKIRKGFKHLISGVRQGEEENEYIISEVKKECECSEVYKKFLEEHNDCLIKYENYIDYVKNEIRAYMTEMNERYKNPFITDQELVRNEIMRMKGAPGLPLPEGKSNFVISGVQANEFEKSFVLGGLFPKKQESEESLIVAESYTEIPLEKGLSKCQKTYLCNYMTFGENCCNPFQPQEDEDFQGSSEELICRCISYESDELSVKEESEEENDEEEEIATCACECPCGAEVERPEDCTCAMPEEEEEEEGPCICAEEDDEEEEGDDSLQEEIIPPVGCTCGVIEVESSGTASDPCLCGYKNCGCQVEDVCVKECFYGPMDAWLSDTENPEPIPTEMKKVKKADKSRNVNTIGGPARRFVILKTFPKGEKFQEKIIKKLLAGLADDGYPLARLPDCHRLPYFNLWMQFRMRKRWNYADAVKNFGRCQNLWNHIDICRRKLIEPKLDVFCTCHASNYTWANAERVFKMARDAKDKYYDQVRKNMVDFAREFLPTLYPYQYPNPRYLYHYFYAYQPSKKENVITEYVWGGHEHKNPKDYKSCICK